jgi:hypothetical protein
MHAAARKQCGIQLERRVLGGGADEDDDAALDMRQERILLRLVEAVFCSLTPCTAGDALVKWRCNQNRINRY